MTTVVVYIDNTILSVQNTSLKVVKALAHHLQCLTDWLVPPRPSKRMGVATIFGQKNHLIPVAKKKRE